MVNEVEEKMEGRDKKMIWILMRDIEKLIEEMLVKIRKENEKSNKVGDRVEKKERIEDWKIKRKENDIVKKDEGKNERIR